MLEPLAGWPIDENVVETACEGLICSVYTGPEVRRVFAAVQQSTWLGEADDATLAIRAIDLVLSLASKS
jgi:hypothetical protein